LGRSLYSVSVFFSLSTTLHHLWGSISRPIAPISSGRGDSTGPRCQGDFFFNGDQWYRFPQVFATGR
jgi:hypothetical protein